MNQYKISFHCNMKGFVGSRNRTVIWDKEERPTYINRLVKKKITGRLAENFIKEDNKAHTLEELMTTQLGRLWIKEIKGSRVKEYKTKP